MPDIEIRIDKRKLKEIQSILKNVPRGFPKIMSRAINKVAMATRADVVRKLSQHLNLKQKRIRDDISILKASYRRWAANIWVRGKRISIREFATTRPRPQGKGFVRPKSGISYKIEKAGGKKNIQSAFFARMSSGYVGVYKRTTSKRFPIMSPKGPSVGGAFAEAGNMVKQVTATAYQSLEKNIDTQVEVLLKQAAKKAV